MLFRSFKFSIRPGTVASKMEKQIPSPVKKKRVNMLALPDFLYPRPCGVYLSPGDQRHRGEDGSRIHGAGLDGGAGARADGHCRPCRPLGAGGLLEVFVPEVRSRKQSVLHGMPRKEQDGEFLKPLSIHSIYSSTTVLLFFYLFYGFRVLFV